MIQRERNLEHERASYAFKCVEDIKNQNNEKAESKYRTAALSAGTLIHKSGLLQALAFYISKKDYHSIAKDMLFWLTEIPVNNSDVKASLKVMYKQLLSLNDEDIIYKTQETRALIVWLKRFSEAMLKDKDKKDEEPKKDELKTEQKSD